MVPSCPSIGAYAIVAAYVEDAMFKKQLPYFVLAFLLPLLLVLTWWGLFSSAQVETKEVGGYRYVYLEATGPYSKLGSKAGEIAAMLKAQNIEQGSEITLIYSDPRTVNYKERQARIGFIIPANATPQAPLLVDTIPVRKAIVATIKAHPLLAYGKAYGALLDYLKTHQLQFHLPAVELYDHSVLQVEMVPAV